MGSRRYYSTRTGKNPGGSHFDLIILKKIFCQKYLEFMRKEYFQEAFGLDCVDAGYTPGTLGPDIEGAILGRVRKDLPFDRYQPDFTVYTEDDMFDLIEFLFDFISKPLEGRHHTYNNCGWHYDTFDKQTGQTEYQDEVNSFLTDYQNGYELSQNGEILALADPGLQLLLDAPLSHFDPENIEKRVDAAIHKFRRHHSSLDERKEAVRDLADVLEFLRPKASKYLLTKKDDGDLFQIANCFAIRHHNEAQQSDYSKSIWYSWMFYFYLATIHAAVRVIKESEAKKPES